ncbi:hypothetical protein ACIG53_03140 [Streptomyces bauhiniae]|uniref:hypothetical protein n=1 Tax=Streptomyces bauhiniae TaxID=2340725 RepID=UPI0037D68B7F
MTPLRGVGLAPWLKARKRNRTGTRLRDAGLLDADPAVGDVSTVFDGEIAGALDGPAWAS